MNSSPYHFASRRIAVDRRLCRIRRLIGMAAADGRGRETQSAVGKGRFPGPAMGRPQSVLQR